MHETARTGEAYDGSRRNAEGAAALVDILSIVVPIAAETRIVQEGWALLRGVSQAGKTAARGGALGIKETATALRTASEAYKGTTRLGHALSKHAGRKPAIWGKITGNVTTWHGQAMKHFRDIVRGPGSFQRVTNSKGTTFLEKVLPDGRGIRLQLDYRFKGFID